MRTFRVEVASDSMLYQDEQREKADRVEFLGAVGQFLEKATQAAQAMPPEATPLLMDLLKFGVTGYRVGRVLEGEFDNVADAIKEQAKQPKQPKPDPEMMKLQATMQMEKEKAQLQMQTRQADLQNQAQIREHELQLEAQKQDMQAQNDMKERQHKAELDQFLEQQKLEFERWKTQLENETKIVIAEMDAKTKLKTQYMSANPNDPMTRLDDNGNPSLSDEITSLLSNVNSSMETLVQTNMMAQQAHQALAEQVMKPKQVVRDTSGKIIGVK